MRTLGWLLWMALALVALAAVVLVAVALPDWSVASAEAFARGRFSTVYPGEGWRWVLWVTGGATGLALLTTLVEVALGQRWFRRRAPKFREALDGADRARTLTALRERVERCAAGGHMIALVDQLIYGALVLRASDIHLSPTHESLRITYRVDGGLIELAALPQALAPEVATRVKVLARLGTHLTNRPQDGRLTMTLAGVALEARVSTLPTDAGERVVIRLLRGATGLPELEALGMPDALRRALEAVLARPQGLLFLTGPVGSGKTTSLYAFLSHIRKTRGSTSALVTLEDPIELQIPFAAQTQIQAAGGVSFAAGLRSVLRQDPNVLMVGEIRDPETAEIAIQAGLTGHLLLTTVHGDSAAGAFTRLLEMGVQPFALASAAIGSLSQRLVRTLCVECRRPVAASPAEREHFESRSMLLPQGERFYAAVGCERCGGEGYSGRRMLAELMLLDVELRRAIQNHSSTGELAQLAMAAGMVPLLRDGLRLALDGETSLTEVMRVAG